MKEPDGVKALSDRIKACRICIDSPSGKPLPHSPRPVAILSETARIGIAGQAPGVRVHHSGRPFTDPSGDRLREWMGVDEAQFYDASKIAIIPMGFCFPGLDAKGADLPPRKECASAWRNEVMKTAKKIDLWLIVGGYAQKWHLGEKTMSTVTQTVLNWREISIKNNGLRMFPLPHPSWRNNKWLKQNQWFNEDLLPELRREISKRL